ncbi:cytochrome c oxidase subunit 5B, mitochondrial-like [Pecten maximus]|uniref:cytochrome c oxidase subunit 5B, mitochondrial-like n=1 Tax=Pecten maximus TaxID=6579 RepID=UPI0014581B4B|nr:cytochrome c oxidase subunit 5B, mitochondrial-like [Pecten maximus]
MAAALCRTFVGLTRRAVLPYQARAYGSKADGGRDIGISGMHSIFPPEESHEGKIETPDSLMPSNLGHMLGEERDEILTELAGAKDHFDFDGVRVNEREGTRDAPIIVRSESDNRIVGCLCDDEQVHINYMVLTSGAPKRCMCGFWYKLVEA